ncbi:uncharacterized protein CLUP02_01551 [Colletotrichum lupini]|uniref:Uncharacterized protein n=1 Tax=Colletotrichum lupini TaxID=145971 RepID=A0A9Q8SCL0_9PEZI|nr:uncharacterized protein CLUP02_01551 [Colletotrichum lupini]UQC74899.1 hypothetical protein CLUP02_01551 [Colletotrichum lupini]
MKLQTNQDDCQLAFQIVTVFSCGLSDNEADNVVNVNFASPTAAAGTLHIVPHESRVRQLNTRGQMATSKANSAIEAQSFCAIANNHRIAPPPHLATARLVPRVLYVRNLMIRSNGNTTSIAHFAVGRAHEVIPYHPTSRRKVQKSHGLDSAFFMILYRSGEEEMWLPNVIPPASRDPVQSSDVSFLVERLFYSVTIITTNTSWRSPKSGVCPLTFDVRLLITISHLSHHGYDEDVREKLEGILAKGPNTQRMEPHDQKLGNINPSASLPAIPILRLSLPPVLSCASSLFFKTIKKGKDGYPHNPAFFFRPRLPPSRSAE